MGPLIEELRARIRASGLRYAEIEQRAGFSKKYLSQLVNGHVDLKIFQLFKILVATEVEFSEFFAAVTRRYRKRTVPISEEQVSAIQEQIAPRMQEMIRKILETLPSDPGPPDDSEPPGTEDG